jgi:hypothetical protein
MRPIGNDGKQFGWESSNYSNINLSTNSIMRSTFQKLWETQETNHKGGEDYGLKKNCPQDYG